MEYMNENSSSHRLALTQTCPNTRKDDLSRIARKEPRMVRSGYRKFGINRWVHQEQLNTLNL